MAKFSRAPRPLAAMPSCCRCRDCPVLMSSSRSLVIGLVAPSLTQILTDNPSNGRTCTLSAHRIHDLVCLCKSSPYKDCSLRIQPGDSASSRVYCKAVHICLAMAPGVCTTQVRGCNDALQLTCLFRRDAPIEAVTPNTMTLKVWEYLNIESNIS